MGKTDQHARITGETRVRSVLTTNLGYFMQERVEMDIGHFSFLLYSILCWYFRKQRNQGTPTDGCNLHTKPQVSKKFDF